MNSNVSLWNYPHYLVELGRVFLMLVVIILLGAAVVYFRKHEK